MTLSRRQRNLVQRMIDGDVFWTVGAKGCPRASRKEINELRRLGFGIQTENDFAGDGPSVHWFDNEKERENAKQLLQKMK
jgi:hypothetical protein